MRAAMIIYRMSKVYFLACIVRYAFTREWMEEGCSLPKEESRRRGRARGCVADQSECVFNHCVKAFLDNEK
jgi:hypothetical protein